MSDHALVLFDEQPGSTAERLERYGTIQAIGRLVSDELDRLKDQFQAEADAIEEATGGAFNVKVPSGAQVLHTLPAPKPEVSDDKALIAWAREQGLDGIVETSKRLAVIDPPGAVDAIDMLADEVEADMVSTVAAKAVLSCIEVVTEDRLSEHAWDRLVEDHGCTQDDEGLISPDGERVPGTAMKRADRQLRVTIPTDLKQRHDMELRTQFQLTAGGEA